MLVDRTTAAAWIAGMAQVPRDSWTLLGDAAAGRGGITSCADGRAFMKANFSNWDARSGAWRDVIGGRFEPVDFGHIKSRYNRQDLANDVSNHILERRNFNRSHKARDLTSAEVAAEARFFQGVKWKARLSRTGAAGLKAGGIAMLFELPFAAAEGWLDVRQGYATRWQAVKKGGIQVSVAGASGFVVGGASFALSAAVSVPFAIGTASLLGAVGMYSASKRSWNLFQRFRNRDLKTIAPSKQGVLFATYGLPLPQTNKPFSWLKGELVEGRYVFDVAGHTGSNLEHSIGKERRHAYNRWPAWFRHQLQP
jgi:hypothetical protein